MKRELERIEIPGEHDARERAWRVVSSAFGEREPVAPRPARRLVPVLVAVVAAAIVAAAFSPPGRAVFHAIRETVGVEKSQPLFSLPTGGRLLVTSDAGVWVVQADGSKRLLGRYAEASWSPHGRYVVAARQNGLFALTPKGEERWSLARPQVRFPRWTGTETDTRIAYLTTSRLHVVVGNGTKDGDAGGLPAAARIAPAWQPGPGFVLTYADTRGRVRPFNDGPGAGVWADAPTVSGRFPDPRSLEWSSDGKRLLLVTRDKLVVFGTRNATPLSIRSERVVAAAFRPGTHDVTLIRRPGEVSQVVLAGRVIFSTAGELGGLTWSPDGRWLLVGYPEADQWIFVRADGRRIVAVSDVEAQFRSRSSPRVEGWAR